MLDITQNYRYAELLQEEIEHYSRVEVTPDLREGGVHAGDCWIYYWQDVARTIDETPFHDIGGFVNHAAARRGRPARVLSLGSGYCGHELKLARRFSGAYGVVCTDINGALFEQAKRVAAKEGLSIEFLETDLNYFEIEPGAYDLIFCHAALHHVINLEHLLDQAAAGLNQTGVFHLIDVCGQNRKLIWDENERFANALLDLLPEAYTEGARIAEGTKHEGMEGVRQQDIPALLETRFEPLFEYRHGAWMRFVCTHKQLGKLLDPSDPTVRRYLDFMIECDRSAVRNGVLRPLEIWGVYRPKAAAEL